MVSILSNYKKVSNVSPSLYKPLFQDIEKVLSVFRNIMYNILVHTKQHIVYNNNSSFLDPSDMYRTST